MKPFLYGMFTMLVLASFVANLILGSLFISQQAELSSLREQVSLSNQTSSSQSTTSSATCAEKYTSEIYPAFSFSYDSCVWELEKKDNAQGPAYGSSVTLKHKQRSDTLMFDLAILSVFGSTTTCSDADYARVGTAAYRITGKENKYSYYEKVTPRGTAEFNAALAAVDLKTLGLDAAKVRFCYAPDIPFITETTVTAQEQGATTLPPTQKLSAVMGIQATAANAASLDGIDEIVKTVRVK